MAANRSRQGIAGALAGFVGGYLAAWWQGRRTRRTLALLRLSQRQADAARQNDMAARLDALDSAKHTSSDARCKDERP